MQINEIRLVGGEFYEFDTCSKISQPVEFYKSKPPSWVRIIFLEKIEKSYISKNKLYYDV